MPRQAGLFLVLLFLLTVALSGIGCQVVAEEDDHPLTKLIAKLLPESPGVRWHKLRQKLQSLDADQRRAGVLLLGEKDSLPLDRKLEVLALVAAGEVDQPSAARGDPDEQVRATAVAVLSRLDTEPVKLPQVLQRTAFDVSPMVRETSAVVLHQQPYPWGLDILKKMLTRDESTAVRGRAATALGGYRDPQALQTLIAAVDDEEFEVAFQARNALKTMTGQDFEYDRQAWAQWLQSTDDPFAQPSAAKK